MKHQNKIAAYSIFSTAFLISHQQVSGEVIYQNIDPDIILDHNMWDTISVQLDLNSDGITDIQFFDREVGWSWVSPFHIYSTEIIYAKSFDFFVKNSNYPSYDIAAFLNTGYSINSLNYWSNATKMRLITESRETDSFGANMSYYPFAHVTDKYIGIQFEIDGANHFGWVRLSITNFGVETLLPYLELQDFAYETNPETPIVISDSTASLAQNLFLTDSLDNNNASDLFLTFDKAINESTLSVYRIFLIPLDGYNNADSLPSTAILESLSPDRYTEILPIGAPHYICNFPSGMHDIEGNEIIAGVWPDAKYYRAIILSVANGITTIQNNTSVPSNIIENEIEPVGIIEDAYNPALFISENILYVTWLQSSGYTLNIYNIQGEMIITNQITETKYVLDLHFLPKGIYFAEQVTGSKRYIKEIAVI